MFDLLPQQLVNGLSLGSNYALVALGLTLVFGVLLIPNFAHGEFFMFGAFLTYSLVAVGLSFWIAMPIAILLLMGVGCIADLIVFRSMDQSSGLRLMIGALATSIILTQAATIIWGSEPRTIPSPMTGVLRHSSFSITYLQILIIAALMVCWIGIWLVLNRTRLGLAIRAVSQNKDAALLMGINMSYVRLSTFAMSAGLGAVGGALLGATFPIYPTMGTNPVLKAFVVLVLGGIGSLWGAVAGGLLLGLSEVLIAGYVSSEMQDIGTFAILVAVLLLRPQGLFGSAEIER